MFTIRLATPDDALAVRLIYAPIVEQTVISFELEPPTIAEIEQRISTTLDQFPWLVCCQDNQVIGYAYAGQHRSRWAYQWACDVSVYIHADWRKHNIGRALYTTLFEILRIQGYFVAFAGITLPNPASVGLHEALGFEPIGIYQQVGYKFGEWHDTGWWQFDLQFRRDEPQPTRPIHKLAGAELINAYRLGTGLIR